MASTRCRTAVAPSTRPHESPRVARGSRDAVVPRRLNEAQRLCVKTGMYSDANSVVGVRIALQRPLRSLQEGCFIDGCFWEGTLGDQPFATSNSQGKIFRGASSEAPFSRLAIMFPYKDGELLGKLLEAMDAINHRTLSATMPGSLVSHQLSPEEITAAESGELDIVSGWHVIDPDCRTIVLEGLAAVSYTHLTLPTILRV